MRSLLAILIAAGTSLSSMSASAASISIDFAGYYLETVGSNTIGVAGGGSATGTPSTLFIGQTSPGPSGGTFVSVTRYLPSGIVILNPVIDGGLWVRRVLNPSADQKQSLNVVFDNDIDRNQFVGRDLSQLADMPLVENLAVDPTVDPFGPLITWTLPSAPGGDIDFIQLVFYNDLTNSEVGTRVVLDGTATSYDIVGPLPLDFNLVVNVRLYDVENRALGLEQGNILRSSRAYISYVAPSVVPEPGTALLLGTALLGMLGVSRRRQLHSRVCRPLS